MKYFKCHSLKHKYEKVLFIPNKYTEIGPDAFKKTNFEIIILPDNIRKIHSLAFSGVKNCSIYLPPSILEIDVSAFDKVTIGIKIYCERNSTVHNYCLEHQIDFSYFVTSLLNKAYILINKQT